MIISIMLFMDHLDGKKNLKYT